MASRAGALPEVLERSGGGSLVPRDDPEALATAIRILLEDPARRDRLARRGRERVVEHFSWSRIAATTAAVYEDVLAERRGGPASTTTSANAG